MVLLTMAVSSQAKSKGKELSGLLLSYMQLEDIHPDSLERNIDSLKQCRKQSKDPAARAVYAAALGKLYAERILWRSVGTDMLDSAVVWYGVALADKQLLAEEKAKRWKPFVVIGRDEGYFNGDMLNVVWRSMVESIGKVERDTARVLPKYGEMIDFYNRRGMRNAALLLTLDSLSDADLVSDENLKKVSEKYADLPLCAEVYLRISERGYKTPKERREWLQLGLNKYPKYKRKAALQNALTRLSDPNFSWEGPSFVYPGKQYQWIFTGRNIQSVLINGEEHKFPDCDPVDTFRDTLVWTAPAPCDYAITFVPRPRVKTTEKVVPINQKIRISALHMVYQVMADNKVRVLVVDSETGEPQKGVKIIAYRPDVKDTVEYFMGYTDQQGKLAVPRWRQKGSKSASSQVRLRMWSDVEQHLPIQTFYVYGQGVWNGAPENSTHHINLYTDRGIYRPGQMVHVSGIEYSQLDWESHPLAGRTHTLKLYDSQYKEVEKKEVVSDEMGVFSAEFELPTGRRNGSFFIKVDNDESVYFRVEEYKRPTFEVTLEDSLYVVGDSCVEVRGAAKNYEGTPLRGARVTGTYSWRNPWFYYEKFNSRENETQKLDTIETDDKGVFRYRFKVLKSDLEQNRSWIGSRRMLNVNVDVLSQQGETHNAQHWYWRIRETIDPPQPAKVDSTFLVRCVKDTFSLAQPGRIEVTTKLHDVYLHYTLSAAGKMWKDDVVRLDNETFAFDIPYREEYDQSLTASFCFVKNGKVNTAERTIYLARPDNQLRAHWDTFRDLLQPGQKEEWRLTLRRPDGTAADANLMLALYDASLDYFVNHRWSFNIYRNHRTYEMSFHDVTHYYSGSSANAWYNQKTKKVREIEFSQIDGQYFQSRVYSRNLYYGAGGPRLLAKSASATNAVMEEAAVAREVSMDAVQDNKVVTRGEEGTEEESEETSLPAVKMRENFNETAFFMPQLRTNKDGQVVVSFTLPESLTRWNLLGVAHTSDMMYTNLYEQIEARKDLMAQLYLPRFLRPGDEAMLTATVRNVSEQKQKGRGVLQILDAKSEKVLKSWKTNIVLESKKDTVLHFPYEVVNNGKCSDLIVRWAVEGTTCSDGEQRLLPVLSATEHITKTLAITAYDPGVTNFDLTELFPNGVTERQLTLQYTTHPEQYALEALPVLAQAKHNDVLSLATAYYAGILGRTLHVNMPDSTEAYLEKIKALQDANGGFRWYPQFPVSPYLTREVSFLLTRLHMLTKGKPAEQVNTKAVHYLLEQRIDSAYFSSSDLRTLYVALWSDVRLSKEEQKKVDYLLKLAKKVEPEKMGYEGQALLALVWNKDGEQRKAKKFVEAFKKYLVTSPDRGSYIEFPKGSFVSIDRKLHIHVQMMEALGKVMPEETKLLSGMRRYLLQQKRTQEWSTPINSANAVFALLNGHVDRKPSALKDLLTLTRKGTSVQNFTAKEDSLGFIRDSIDIEDGKLPVRLRLHKFSKDESWGGVYADFEQPFDQVTAHSTGLSVTQEYPQEAKTGNRYIVRYRISADRDYEYVTLIVPRPAFTEPVNQRSGYGCIRASLGWAGGLGYYRQVHDATTEFSFYQIPRGEYLIEETLYVERDGRYHSGIATIRCEYADEFQGHSGDCVIKVKNE